MTSSGIELSLPLKNRGPLEPIFRLAARETPQQRAENERRHANEFLDLSRFFVPLFGMILGIVWVGSFCYPSIFHSDC